MEFNLVHRERWISFFVFALHTHVHIQSSKSNNSGAPAITIVKSNDQKHFVIYVEINEQIMYIWGNTTKNCIKSNPQSHFENLRCVALRMGVCTVYTFHHLNMCVNTEQLSTCQEQQQQQRIQWKEMWMRVRMCSAEYSFDLGKQDERRGAINALQCECAMFNAFRKCRCFVCAGFVCV